MAVSITRRKLKFAAAILLVGGLVLVGLQLFRKRPVSFSVGVRYGRAAADLEAATLEVFRVSDDALVQRKAWRYSAAHPAPSLETTKLRMAAGRYRFQVRLEYAQAAPGAPLRAAALSALGEIPGAPRDALITALADPALALTAASAIIRSTR